MKHPHHLHSLAELGDHTALEKLCREALRRNDLASLPELAELAAKHAAWSTVLELTRSNTLHPKQSLRLELKARIRTEPMWNIFRELYFGEAHELSPITWASLLVLIAEGPFIATEKELPAPSKKRAQYYRLRRLEKRVMAPSALQQWREAATHIKAVQAALPEGVSWSPLNIRTGIPALNRRHMITVTLDGSVHAGPMFPGRRRAFYAVELPVA